MLSISAQLPILRGDEDDDAQAGHYHHLYPNPWKSLSTEYSQGGVADTAFRRKDKCQGLDLSDLRPDLCPFHPFYAIQLMPFKSFILALHIYLQPHIKINAFSSEFIWCITVLERISSGNTGRLEISYQVNIWGLVPEGCSSFIRTI